MKASWMVCMDGTLPTVAEDWPKFSRTEIALLAGDTYDISLEEVQRYAVGRPWVWSGETLFFVCDVHADTEGFLRSLVATGGVELTGPGDHDFELTALGREGVFIIGGDCFDKGPENLRLLRALGALRSKGAKVEILAGNHDVRALVGLAYAGRKEPRFAHLWVRMGKKSIPLFREIYEQYVLPNRDDYEFPSDEDVRAELFPDAAWFENFAAAAGDLVSPAKMEREVRRIREKIVELGEAADQAGLSLGMVHAATVAAKRLFLEPDGEFAWFFQEMQLARQAGSFLFVHAGVDDKVARWIRDEGVAGVNARFRDLMEHDLFELYHGAIGNVFRTKYRETDLPFGPDGIEDMHRAGIYAIVHGHRNLCRGQRVSVYNGMLNFECDASIDRNTRVIEGLNGPGAAAVTFRPEGRISATSTDYGRIKVFEASRNLGWTTFL
ncbi:MAG: metallophosphoesterase [Candidatus Eisenbacteria bacterium]|nr:metallophosphoesterase [Candidatus Eisenbacteria bacterium]